MDQLTDRARELVRANPGLTSQQAYRRALDDDPGLARAHHLGDDGPPPAPAAAPETDHHDPGGLLLQAIAAKVATGVPRDQAQAAVFAAYPAVVSAHHEGRLIPRQAQGSKAGAPAEVHAFRAALAFRTAALDEDPVEV